MDKKTLSDVQIEKMIDILSKKHNLMQEALESVLYMTLPPTEYVEDIADFSDDYLAEFLCSFLWQEIAHLADVIDWKRFDSVQWGKLTARFGDKLNGKSDVVPYWGAEEWAYIISLVCEEQLEEACLDCDKWDGFTAKNWGEVSGLSKNIDERIKNASAKFTLEDWRDFFESSPCPEDYTDLCPCCEQLKKEYPDLML